MKKNKINAKEIFEKYKIYKFKLNSTLKQSFALVDEIDKNIVKNKAIVWKKYTSQVEEILGNMHKENAEFLKKIYIENLDRYDFHYSDSTFYWRLKKATKEFLAFAEL